MAVNAVDLDLLRTFQAIYRAGTMTGAANALHLSQPAVTARLQALERACGTRLFDRGSRGCTPTAAADDLARRCEAPLGALAAIAASLGRPTELRNTRLRLGAPGEFFEYYVAPRVAALTKTGMRITVRFGPADELLAQLLHGDLDLVVSTVKPSDKTEWAALADEEFLLVAAPQLAAEIDAGLREHDPAQVLRAVSHITYDEQQSVTRRWWRHVLGSRPPAGPAITAPDLRAVRALVLAGAGISALPAYLVAGAIRAGDLVELHPSIDGPINTLYLATMAHLRHQPHVDTAWTAVTALR